MPEVCSWTSLEDACREFVVAASGHEGSAHIKKLHYYVACRLVLEGGFDPAYITPRPPFTVTRRGKRRLLAYDPSVATGAEATVFGGLKTKDIDVVVNVPALGPCLTVSMKGSLNAYRNLTNRLEEAVGDCTNIHMAYAPLVYGFLHVFRANREGPIPASGVRFLKSHKQREGHVAAQDVAITSDGRISQNIFKYAQAMMRLTGRRDLRNDASRYEAIGLLLLEGGDGQEGVRYANYPDSDSAICFDHFFPTLYKQYELRFVYGAPNLKHQTQRLYWDPESPMLSEPLAERFPVRLAEADDLPGDTEEGDEPVPRAVSEAADQDAPPTASE